MVASMHVFRVAGDKIDSRMEGIVNRMFEKCFEEKQFKQALGIAIEARRMDIFIKSIERADNRDDMLTYAFRVVMNFQQNRNFRGELLRYLNKKDSISIQAFSCEIFFS